MKIANMKSAALVLALGAVLSLGACSVQKTEEGELPKVDADVKVDAEPGNLPKYDVDAPDVDVTTKQAEVAVPDVDVKTETKTIPVPDVDVKMPEDKPDVDEKPQQ